MRLLPWYRSDSLIFSKDLPRIKDDAKLGNSPLWFGEWGLPTQFNATDEFLYKWADAQKFAYSQGAGWLVRTPRHLIFVETLLIANVLVLELQDWDISRHKWDCSCKTMVSQYTLRLHMKVLIQISRSYLEGVKLGFLTKDPSQLHDPNVCAPYINKTSSSVPGSNLTGSNSTTSRRAHHRRLGRIH